MAETRAESGLTQEQLASVVGLARSALAKIETGARNISAAELVAVARELHRRVEWFVLPSPPTVVSHRAAHADVATQAIDTELERIVRDVEFVAEQVPDVVGAPPPPATVPSSNAEADALASQARGLLGLGSEDPVANLSLLAPRIGLLPFSVHLGEGADAGTVLLPVGGVSVVNGDLRVGRRRLALAHELGHYLI